MHPGEVGHERAVDVNVMSGGAYSPESQEAIGAINAALGNDDCSEIHGHGPDQVFVKYKGKFHRMTRAFAGEHDYNRFIKQMVEEAEAVQTWDDIREHRRGVIRMADGSSLTVVMPPLATSINFSIRKHNAFSWQAQDLVANGSFTEEMMEFLRSAVRARANILVVGVMGSGKTSLLSILTKEFGSGERIGVVEEVPEIWVAKPHVGYYTYQPLIEGLGLDDMLDVSLYMRFDRIIVGEIHMQGLAKMLEAMMVGSDGSMSTYHAGTSEMCVERLKIGLQWDAGMTEQVAAGMIRNSLDMIVVLGRQDGVHRCLEITEIDWRRRTNEADIGLNRLFMFEPGQEKGAGVHAVKGKPDPQGRIMQKAHRYGVPMSDRWFAAPELRDRF